MSSSERSKLKIQSDEEWSASASDDSSKIISCE